MTTAPTSVIMFLTAIATTILMVPALLVLRRAGVVDRPNARSSHSVPTVRGGGIAIMVIIASWLAWFSYAGAGPIATHFRWVLGAVVTLATISFVDDISGVGPSLRLAIQGTSAAIAVIAVLDSRYELTGITGILLVAIIWLWIAGYTNAFNFMDGINGIAAIQAMVTALGTAAIAHEMGLSITQPVVGLSSVIAGAALGFLPFNFPRARVFMGDVSSAPLGFLLALLAVWIAADTHLWALVWIALLHANFVLDTGLTLVRRALRGDRLHDAHREHFYQRLVRAGWSHTSVTLTEAGLQVLVALALWQATNAAWPIKVAVGVAVVVAWLAFFGFAEHVFCKSPAGGTDAEMLAARRRVQRDPDGAVR